MALSNTIGRAQRSTPRPVLPALPTGGVSLRSSANNSPQNTPTVLEDSTLEDNGGVKLSTTPEGTPPGYQSHNILAAPTMTTKNMTPPDSKFAAPGPLVIDGSTHGITANADSEPSNSPSGLVKAHLTDDPFVSTSRGQMQSLPNPAAVPSQAILSLIKANLAHAPDATASMPGEDRIGQIIGAHNAQGYWPARACICVFNLSNMKTNDQLQLSVEAAFEPYGPCFVKIKNDRNHQPNAIIQYQYIADAEKALDEANGTEIDGRICRVEKGNVPRSVIISLLSNAPFPETELRESLVGLGDIESITPTGSTTTTSEDASAYIVQFAYFDDCRDVVKKFRHHSIWRVVPAPKPRRQTPYNIAPPRTPQGMLYRDSDTHSVFLGSLPDSVTEDEVRTLLAPFGTIASVAVISKPMTTGGLNTFAFVEFKFAEDAQSAADFPQTLRGEKIRVERKQYSKRRAARVSSSIGPLPGPMPAPNTPGYWNAPYNSHLGINFSPYQGAGSYNGAPQPFTYNDYHTTPPTPVYMVPPNQYMSPAPRMRSSSSHHDTPRYGHNVSYGPAPILAPGPFTPLPANYRGMNAIAEEADANNVFN